MAFSAGGLRHPADHSIHRAPAAGQAPAARPMRFLAVFSGSMAPWSEAPQGRYSKAQGHALGIGLSDFLRPEGATPAGCFALSGLGFLREYFQGVALGFQFFAPSGLPVTDSYSLKTARNRKLSLDPVIFIPPRGS